MTLHQPRLSEHFALSEFTVSQAAARAGICNTPIGAQLDNLHRLAATLEQVRLLLGAHPVLISSGFRSLEVNRLVGGAAQSAHLQVPGGRFHLPRLRHPCASLPGRAGVAYCL